MPSFHALLHILFTMRGRYHDDDANLNPNAGEPHSGTLKRWLSTTIAWALQRNRPVQLSPIYRQLPIVAGLLAPFTILLEIPGLTEPWYVRLDEQTHEAVEYKAKTPLLTAGLAVSMTCIIIANVALVVRFLEKHVQSTTIVVIGFLFTHDAINIAAITASSIERQKDEGFTYATAYWLTVFATIASTITNISLIWDYIKTYRFAYSGSGLTNKQRLLVIVNIVWLSWLAVGAGVYTALLGLKFVDSLYFTVVSIETIGFGDIVPSNTGARVFTFFYVIVGILNLALAVSTIRSVIAESFTRARVLRRIRMRRTRRNLIGNSAFSDDQTSHVQHHSPPHFPFTLFGRRRIKESDEEMDLTQEKPRQMTTPTTLGDEHLLLPNSSYANDAALMEDLVKGEPSSAKSDILLPSVAFIIFWLVGSLAFTKTEGWDYGTSLYFGFVTWTTIGYGDVAPKTPTGRAIFVFWALIGVGSLTALISALSEAYGSMYQTIVSHPALEHQLSQRAIALVRSRIDCHAQARKARAIATIVPTPSFSYSHLDTRTLAQDLISHARRYHPHMRHALALDNPLAHPLASGSSHLEEGNVLPKELEDPASELRVLLLEELNEEDDAIKETVLCNSELRKALFALSYDKSFDKLMQAALVLAQDNDIPTV